MTPDANSPLLSKKAPWIHSVACSPSELTNLTWALQREHYSEGVVRLLRGNKCKCISALFDEVAAAFQFPYYFGENWDALDECINDLEWLPGNAYLIVISDSLSLLTNEGPDEFAILARMLTRTCEEWAAGISKDSRGTGRQLLFTHCSIACRDKRATLLVGAT